MEVRYVLLRLFLIVPLLVSATQKETVMKKFTVTSTAFVHESYIPARYSYEGEDISPELSWSGVPEKTQSYVIACLDPDAPPGTWVHWVLYDLPGDTLGLEENLAKNEVLPNGAKQGLCWGVDSFTRVGYYGPCPPVGHGDHRYYFHLYALDVKSLGLNPRATWPEVEQAMDGHILGKGTLMGKFRRD